jgi:hypothetical protein
LEGHYEELKALIQGRLAKLPPPGGKDDSWSW